MKQAAQNKSPRKPLAIQMAHRIREGLLILSAALALFLLVSFCTYHSPDPGWLSTGMDNKIANAGGRVGAWFADVFLSLFGYVAYLFPGLIVYAAWVGVRDSANEEEFQTVEFSLRTLGFIAILISACSLASIYLAHWNSHLPAHAGGMIGDVIGASLADVLSHTGTLLILVAGLLCGVTLFTGLSWLGVVDALGSWILTAFNFGGKEAEKEVEEATAEDEEEQDDEEEEEEKESPRAKKAQRRKEVEFILEEKAQLKKINARPEPVLHKPAPVSVSKPMVPIKYQDSATGGSIPPLSLLDPAKPSEGKEVSEATLRQTSEEVEKRLLDFGIDVKVVAVHPGPVVTRFELELAPGIKASRISGLAKDLARSLSAISVRVVEVIPGKSVVGLELPNEHREIVCLREVLESQRYAQVRSPATLALGKDIGGNPVVVDLAKMPHLLVAGTTGSGKSVSINAMLLSMLFKATPDELRLILIDPKMLELSVYEGIPHLLTPVITDMKDAASALRWCVAEMDRRYRLMAFLGVRNLGSYNAKIEEGNKTGNPVLGPVWMAEPGSAPPPLPVLPMIVVVADELADMMMVVGKKVEELIARIAQKARASGIHLLLATQRPSVDVITGLIKANIPTRIAFQVSSRIDSRTILDQQGAEQLLGHGDMLYMPPGTGVPVRVHGAYVGDDEVHRVVAAWQAYGKPDYLADVTEPEVEGGSSNGFTSDGMSDGEADPFYDQAVRIITESRRASVSLIQRRLKIGFNRAARIMEEMEASGVVSPMDSSGTREVLAAAPPEA